MTLIIASTISFLCLILYPTSNTSLRNYLEMFKGDAKKYGVTLTRPEPKIYAVEYSLYIKDKNGSKIEVDAYVAGGTRTIYFNAHSYMCRYNRKTLVYHELAHYYLDRDHDMSKLPDSSMPKSIMSTDTDFNLEDLPAEQEEYYIKELFTN